MSHPAWLPGHGELHTTTRRQHRTGQQRVTGLPATRCKSYEPGDGIPPQFRHKTSLSSLLPGSHSPEMEYEVLAARESMSAATFPGHLFCSLTRYAKLRARTATGTGAREIRGFPLQGVTATPPTARLGESATSTPPLTGG